MRLGLVFQLEFVFQTVRQPLGSCPWQPAGPLNSFGPSDPTFVDDAELLAALLHGPYFPELCFLSLPPGQLAHCKFGKEKAH